VLHKRNHGGYKVSEKKIKRPSIFIGLPKF
jgi:hypothetical protein